ncbi:MAG: hypothetical protein ACM3ML_06215 [Micromonosporaceae bacterium]
MAQTAKQGAAQRIHGARTWAAPRIEQAARSVQQDVGPKVSSILEATAQRVEPAQKSAVKMGRRARGQARKTSRDVSLRREKMLANARGSGRSWPKRAGGIAFALATIGAVVAVVMRRRANGGAIAAPAGEDVTSESEEAAADAEAFDGQVRMP